jgi:hypothetical protein
MIGNKACYTCKNKKKDLTEVNEPTGHMICMARQGKKRKIRRRKF